MRSLSRSGRGKIALAAAAGASLVLPLAVVVSPAQAADPVDITILGTNDFHGRLLPDGRGGTPGAASFVGAVEALRAENPTGTIFAAAGDLIGASTFESFIAHDKPTIDALNEAGLDVSAVGNHELDQGYDDLVNRVMAPESETNPEGGAAWQYIAANLDEPGDADLIPPTWTEERAGVTVGFVGAVTEDLPSLVSPAGIEGITVEDIVASTNAAADELTADGADIVVLLVHEGAPSTDCAAMTDPSTTWGEIVSGVNANVDAIISGHTHLAYSCEFPVEGLGDRMRPVVSAGQYGAFVDKLDFTIDPDTGEISAVAHELIDTVVDEVNVYPDDPETKGIVDQAVADAEGPGSVPLGEISASFNRAVQPDDTPEDGPSENRGGESTLGNLVAEVQRWATRTDEKGAAQIAFMNPGGLRADMTDTDGDGFPETVTYKEAAVVQPFANTLVNMTMTGAQIKTLLEQQWQRDAEGAIPSRPFLRLGTSRGFEFTYDTSRAEGDRITGMYLRNKPIEPTREYSVTANSFLAAGGDNFRVFAEATGKRDTGVADLQAMVDYMAAKASGAALAPDYRQHAVGVQLPKGKKVKRGGKLRLQLSSLAMTAMGDLQDNKVLVKLGKNTIGKASVDNTLINRSGLFDDAGDEILGGFDETGTATVVAQVPRKAKVGPRFVRIVGKQTGTSIKVPIRITRK